ncbi:hypothetical protein B0H14DRAFT_2393801, partial [Mycena olivaceomarginata]
LGQTTAGIYAIDPLDGIHPDTINCYYSVAGARRHRRRGETGAGHASDDESVDSEDSDPDALHELDPQEELENQIEADQAQNIRHTPIKVALHHSPFEEDEDEADFLDLLEVVLSQPDILPDDYGVVPREWEDAVYPEVELVVVLPRDEWFRRAVQWAQALDLLNRVLEEDDV